MNILRGVEVIIRRVFFLFSLLLLFAPHLSAEAQSNVPPPAIVDTKEDGVSADLPRQTGEVQQGILIPPPPQANVKDDPASPGWLDPSLPMPDVRIIDNPDDSGGVMRIFSRWGSRKKPYTAEQFQTLRAKVDKIWVTRSDSINGVYENVIELPLDRNAEFTDEIGDKAVFYRVKTEKGKAFRYSTVIGPVKAINNGKLNAVPPSGEKASGHLPYIAVTVLALVALIAFVLLRVKRKS